jgi:hypothetical protein
MQSRRPVSDGFGDMFRLDLVAPFQIRQRPRHPQEPVMTTCRELDSLVRVMKLRPRIGF